MGKLCGAGGDAVADDFEDAFAFFADEGETGGADGFGAVSEFGAGNFDVLDELGMAVEVEHGHIPAVDFEGFLVVA